MRLSFALASGLAVLLPFSLVAAPNSEAPSDPWVLGEIGLGHGDDTHAPRTVAQNALAIQIGEEGEAAVAYDLDLCRMLGAWTGKISLTRNAPSGSAPVAPVHDVVFLTGGVAGFLATPLGAVSPGPAGSAFTWQDPRGSAAGPLPAGHAHFEGFFVTHQQTILKWNINGTEVMELPAYDVVLNGGGYFTRTFQVAAGDQALRILVADDPQPDGPVGYPTHQKTPGEVLGLEDKERVMQSTPWVHGDRGEVMIWAAGDPDGSMWRLINGELALEVPPRAKPATFQIAYWTAPKSDPDGHTAPLFFREPEIDLGALARQGVWRTFPVSDPASATKSVAK